MASFYDRQGRPIDLFTWGGLIEDRNYQRVAETTIGRYWISTVWLGLDHNFWHPGNPPLIFETMIFDEDRVIVDMFGFAYHDVVDELTTRYLTEADALLGHDRIVGLIADIDAVNHDG